VHDGLPGVGYGAVVAVPLIDVTPGYYFWGQTWGRFASLCGGWGINIGDTQHQREIHFDGGGAMVYRPGALDHDAHMQRAGYILSSQMVMLQLAP
ncbi:unnamed protein product, partial [marine sediment metagenome]